VSVKQSLEDILTVIRFTKGIDKCKVQTLEGTIDVECKDLHVLGKTAAHVVAEDNETFVIFEEGVKCELSDGSMTCWKVL